MHGPVIKPEKLACRVESQGEKPFKWQSKQVLWQRPKSQKRGSGVSPAKPVAPETFRAGASHWALFTHLVLGWLSALSLRTTCSSPREPAPSSGRSSASCPRQPQPLHSRTDPASHSSLVALPGPRRPSCSGTSAGASTTSSWPTTWRRSSSRTGEAPSPPSGDRQYLCFVFVLAAAGLRCSLQDL